ncbi:Hypothetical predicted protein [Olea europaea subsp. europaea]|uniref:Uncharacterized protein n=1 Tax=Olea europaea subsp. europaea TaxID=158383 RepID=A0A8S0T220_OLEEU|nr:Hypothetical predicted protein [Olea europaea subsp. europaea]
MEKRAVGISGSSLTRGEVEELLLDQRIFLEIRLRTVKLEIEQHVTSEFKKLQEFLATLMAPAGQTTAAVATPVDIDAKVSEGAHIAGRPDDDQGLMLAAIDDLLVTYDSYSSDRGVMEPSHAAPINDAEFKSCTVTNGYGVVTETLLPAIVPEAGCALPTTRRHSAQRLAPSTRTPYTRGRSEQRSKCE